MKNEILKHASGIKRHYKALILASTNCLVGGLDIFLSSLEVYQFGIEFTPIFHFIQFALAWVCSAVLVTTSIFILYEIKLLRVARILSAVILFLLWCTDLRIPSIESYHFNLYMTMWMVAIALGVLAWANYRFRPGN